MQTLTDPLMKTKIESDANRRVLTGIRASGKLHIGNYFGAVRPALELQKKYLCNFFVADLHALTTNKDAKLMSDSTFDCVALWLACGLERSRSIIYRQSDVPFVAEFAWYLSSVTGMGLLEKGHAYKDALANSREVNHAIFSYPVLMAADICMYDADLVPVGKDQKQHVEMARDMAGSFNAVYGDNLIKLPEVVIDEKVMLIPGLDGRKMSKSYGNEIPFFCDEKTLRKKILSVVTDSTSLEAPKSIEGTVLGDFYKLFATPVQVNDLGSRMQQGGMGWGHAKEELFEVINTYLKETRAAYVQLRGDEAALEMILEDGAEKARAMAKPVINRVREAMGFRVLY